MKLAFALTALVSQVAAQTGAQPSQVFTTNISPTGIGNGCSFGRMANPLLVCTSSDGSVTALNPSNAASPILWSYAPNTSGQVKSASGVTFGATYLIYSAENAGSCRVEALSLSDGSLLWNTELGGACSGTPVLSSDEAYAFVTHNPSDGSGTGTFTIIKTSDASIFYQYSDDQPLSPPGIYHMPTYGNYLGGEGNPNDIVVFGNAPPADATGVSTTADSFAFQFPVGFQGTADSLTVTTLLSNNNWESITPPLLTKLGLRMHWGVSRGDLLAWTDREFSRDVGGFKISLGRGSPSWQAVNAEIATDSTEDVLFASSAGNAFFALNAENLNVTWTADTVAPIYTKALVSPDDSIVYIVDQSGLVLAYDAATGAVLWQMDATAAFVYAGAALSPAGDVLYFADMGGIVYGWKVAEATPTAPVPAPVVAPVAGSMAPISVGSGAPATTAPGTTGPVAGPVAGPLMPSPVAPSAPVAVTPSLSPSGSELPSILPSGPPMEGSSSSPVASPVESPVASPVAETPSPEGTMTDMPVEESPVTDSPVVRRTQPPSGGAVAATSVLAVAVGGLIGFFM